MAIKHNLPYQTLALILFCLLSPPIVSAADTLKQGDALNASSSLVSNNRLFTLGFQGLNATESSSSYLGIWLNSDPTHPFWLANRDQPIADDSGVLSIDGSGNMKLNYSGGDLVELYSSSQSKNLAAILEETGDFVLKDANSADGETLWESFGTPTDSLLPGMKLGTDHKTGKKWSLTSWLSGSIPSSGAFTLEWNFTSKQLVVKRRGVTFWTNTPSISSDRELLDPGFWTLGSSFFNVSNADEDYFMYKVALNQYSSQDQQNFTLWRLGYDGSIWDQNSGMTILNSAACDGHSTEYGCKRWEGPKCRNDGDRFEVRSGYFVNTVATVDDDNSSISISDCKDMCWKNCSCVGTVTYNSNGTGCRFYYGNFTQDLTGSAVQYNVIIPHSRTRAERNWVWALAAVAFALIVALVIIFLYLRRRRNKEKLLNELLTLDSQEEGNDIENDASNKGQNLTVYSISTIMAATNNFSLENKLGQGGFGPVYKGKLPGGREIAVKRLSWSSGQGMVEFKNELILIAKLQHTNLVRLLGCCIHGQEKMLVYEYMPNKSLDSFIFDQSGREMLDWKKRLEIINGIAQGMLYLHKYSRLRIIHRDLKASNILLDENLNPKISDFGMARIFKTNELEVNTNRIVGTYGYMSPEYAMWGIFSVKSDVFSFGVLLLEIISGRKNHSIIQTDPPLNLVGYAWELWKEGNALELMDPTLRDSCSKDQVLRCIQVGLLCVEDKADDRPTMSDVITMLTSETAHLPSPKQPAFTNPRSLIDTDSSRRKPSNSSTNQMSISTMEAR